MKTVVVYGVRIQVLSVGRLHRVDKFDKYSLRRKKVVCHLDLNNAESIEVATLLFANLKIDEAGNFEISIPAGRSVAQVLKATREVLEWYWEHIAKGETTLSLLGDTADPVRFHFGDVVKLMVPFVEFSSLTWNGMVTFSDGEGPIGTLEDALREIAEMNNATSVFVLGIGS